MTPPLPRLFDEIAGLELSLAVRSGLAKDQITVPTPVQAAAIGAIIEGHHVVIESGTGSGKTLAYLLPVLQRLHRDAQCRALCLAPATELAVQILRVAERYKAPELRTIALVATANQSRTAMKLEKSVRFIAGTPGRVLEMYERRKLKGVNLVVLDEPEPILSGRDADFLCEVLSRPEPKLQIVLAAATYGKRAEWFIQKYLGPDCVRIQIADNPLKERIEHLRVSVRNPAEKDFVLAGFLKKHKIQRAIVFVNDAALIRHVFRYLSNLGQSVATVSQERSKLQVCQAVSDFSKGRVAILITTDQAATGLDFVDVPWVLHFDLPSSGKAYVHRAGRTGRAGRDGRSVVFLTEHDRAQCHRLEQELGLEFRNGGG